MPRQVAFSLVPNQALNYLPVTGLLSRAQVLTGRCVQAPPSSQVYIGGGGGAVIMLCLSQLCPGGCQHPRTHGRVARGP